MEMEKWGRIYNRACRNTIKIDIVWLIRLRRIASGIDANVG